MLTRYVCLWWVIALFSAGVNAQEPTVTKSATASISGRIPVLDPKTGQRAVITWTRQITAEATKAPIAGAVLTDDKGQFTIDSLSAGTYALCVQVPGSAFLDPCVWNDKPPSVSIKSGEKSSNNKVDLEEGVSFQFQVADTEQRVAARGNGTGVVLSAAFVLPNGRQVNLPLQKSETAGHTMELLIPGDRDLPLLIEGKGLAFSDEQGRPWARDKAAYVIKKNTAGEKQKTTTVEVKGH